MDNFDDDRGSRPTNEKGRERDGKFVLPESVVSGMSSWEFICDEARYEWSRACNFHRGADLGHSCANPPACRRRLAEAGRLEMFQRNLARKWS